MVVQVRGLRIPVIGRFNCLEILDTLLSFQLIPISTQPYPHRPHLPCTYAIWQLA
jgi:hypothetical protein